MRYRSLIVFRLGRWSSLLPTGFLVSRGTLVLPQFAPLRVQDCYFLRSRFPSVFLSLRVSPWQPSTPAIRRSLVWPAPSSLAATMGIDFFFLLLRVLRCFSSPGALLCNYFIHYMVTGHYPSRVPPFGYLRIYAYLQLPAAFRSLSRPSSAISALASTQCSYSLDLFSLSLTTLLRPISSYFVFFFFYSTSPPATASALPFHDLRLRFTRFVFSLCSFQGARGLSRSPRLFRSFFSLALLPFSLSDPLDASLKIPQNDTALEDFSEFQ